MTDIEDTRLISVIKIADYSFSLVLEGANLYSPYLDDVEATAKCFSCHRTFCFGKSFDVTQMMIGFRDHIEQHIDLGFD